jgi:eukaryotic-like serine/threonine-protein kinase
MGAVWVAEHEKLHTEVVVKFILGSDASLPEAQARFEREATLAAQAKSPHVVQVFDHGLTNEGVPYIAMERLHGEDLATRLERETRISPTAFAEWFRQICAGIGRAHSRGIIHRDLKPENVFLCNEDGEVLVKLLDFGIAKGMFGRGTGATLSGAMLGTVHFMSPEQAMGDAEVDTRSDLWSLGVLAFYCLTGRLPFFGDALGAIVVQITTVEPPAPSSLVPGLPRTVDAWMKRALAKDPKDRFQDAREMASAFHEAIFGFQASRPFDFGETDTLARGPEGVRLATTLTPATGHGFAETGLNSRSRLLPLAGLSLVVLASTVIFLGPTFQRALSGERPEDAVTRIEALSPAVVEAEANGLRRAGEGSLKLEDIEVAEAEENSEAPVAIEKNPRTTRSRVPQSNSSGASARKVSTIRSPATKDNAASKRDLSMKLE